MRAEIISIGTELLVGSILNTNARFLSRELADHAVDVYRQVTVGDNLDRIVECLKAASERSEILVTSGGLGPTEDDVTARALTRFLGRPLVFHRPTHRHILKRLKKRKLRMTKLIARQCYIPRGVIALQNSMGTAPGMLLEYSWDGQKRWLVALPGPPRELEPLFRKAWPLLTRIAKIRREHFEIRSIRITGLLEAQVAGKVTDLLKMKPPLTVGIYAKPQEVELKIMAKAASRARAVRKIGLIEKKIRRRLGRFVYETGDRTLAHVVGDLLRKKRATLAAAESCTGGLFSNFVTDVSGSSDYFLGGLVTYSNKIKRSTLGIREDFLRRHGAVSAEVAREMAQRLRRLFHATYGVSITGIAGPSGGSRRKPVGLVYTAVAGPKRTVVLKNLFLGERAVIKKSSAFRALDMLRLELMPRS